MNVSATDKFEHKVDKKCIPACSILGVNIAAINMDWLLDFTQKNIHALSGDYMCVANVHTTVTAFEDKEYKAIQNGGILAIPDGGPLSLIGHKRGFQYMERTTGPTYMETILKLSPKNGWKHFFYGSTDETLQSLKDTIKKENPSIQITGMYSPPFRELTEDEDTEIIKRINMACPDFLWVGLGAPKQERWMATHQGKVKGLMVGVGAGFDYMVGNIQRAPRWMQNNNLEWLYRLKQDPQRLFYRYWSTNWKFILNAYLRGK